MGELSHSAYDWLKSFLTSWESGAPGKRRMMSAKAHLRSLMADYQVAIAQRDALLAASKEARDELRHPDHTPGDWSVQVVLKQLDAAIETVK